MAGGLFLLPQLSSQFGLILCFGFIGFSGGLFIVPLFALIQFHAGEHELGKILAGNNLSQNIGMVSFLVLTVLASVYGVQAVGLLYFIAFIALFGGLVTVLGYRQSLVRFLLSYVMSRHYRVMVQGLNNLPEKGGVLLLGNHISWID